VISRHLVFLGACSDIRGVLLYCAHFHLACLYVVEMKELSGILTDKHNADKQ